MFGGATAGIIKVPDQYATIQAGINAAFPGDTVLVAAGTYYENIYFKGKAITVASQFIIDADTTHINNTIIDGSKPSDPNKGSVVSFVSGEDTTSVLCGFTITGGNGTYYAPYSTRAGGGIYCLNSGCKIIANKIINNSITGPGASGGGLAALPEGSSAYVILRNNQILQNSITANSYPASGGGVWLPCNGTLVNNRISFNSIIQNAATSNAMSGGVECFSSSSDRRKVVVESNKITHNSVKSFSTIQGLSALAGGIAIFQGYGRLAKNEVSHNELWVNSDRNAAGAGIELYEVPDSLVVEGNIIRENAVTHGVGWGGGLNFYYASSTLINNIIDGNSATNGGGILIAGGTMKLINNTIVNNRATSGGGICLGYYNPTNYLMNTITWGNQATTNPAIHIYTGTIHIAYSDVQGGWLGTGNIKADPLFADTLFHLSSASPCINAGIDSLLMGGIMVKCPPDDYEGDPRPYPGTRPDIGADETVITGIKSRLDGNIPKEYALSQNYPNPFNPSTTIEFALPKSAFITLKVYNLLGEEVATLVAEKRSAGIHKINWEATGLASGVYLYRLEAGEYVQNKKLILLR